MDVNTHMRRPVQAFVAILLISTFLQVLPVSSSTLASQSVVPVPETPAGEQLSWILNEVNSGGVDFTEEVATRRFAPAFLSGLSPDQLVDIIQNYVAPAGPLGVVRFEGGVTAERANALLRGPNGLWRIRLEVESVTPYRIVELFFEPTALSTRPDAIPNRSWSDLKRDLIGITPRISFLSAEIVDGECVPFARVASEEPLAVASSFKLYVLGTLARSVSLGETDWNQLLPLDPGLISLPNGSMRYQKAGSLFTLEHYAEQMISESDNTATDHLIGTLGRTEVEATMDLMGHEHADLNRPLMMTREWFAIRMRFSDEELNTYIDADEDRRREMLDQVASPRASTLEEWEPWPGPRAVDSIEWFASAGDLCRATASLLDQSSQPGMEPVLNALSIEPVITLDPADWTYVGYKGGFETGVHSHVWLLQRADGRWFSLAGIINDADLSSDGYELTDLLIEASELLARQF